MRFVALFVSVLLVGSSAQLATAQGTAPAVSGKGTGASGKPKREPTAGQLAARERIRKCGAEWKEAKAKGTTGGTRWPQYWKSCNARLKGGSA